MTFKGQSRYVDRLPTDRTASGKATTTSGAATSPDTGANRPENVQLQSERSAVRSGFESAVPAVKSGSTKRYRDNWTTTDIRLDERAGVVSAIPTVQYGTSKRYGYGWTTTADRRSVSGIPAA